jgi:hypothetical protein
VSDFEIAVSVALGVGLAAATGLRVFLPLLVASVAAYTGHLPLAESFAWLATPPALILLSVATLVEILAYYIPGLITCSTRSPRRRRSSPEQWCQPRSSLICHQR